MHHLPEPELRYSNGVGVTTGGGGIHELTERLLLESAIAAGGGSVASSVTAAAGLASNRNGRDSPPGTIVHWILHALWFIRVWFKRVFLPST